MYDSSCLHLYRCFQTTLQGSNGPRRLAVMMMAWLCIKCEHYVICAVAPFWHSSLLCNVHIHLSTFPINATVTYHIYPNTRKEFFLNLTHLKNWSGLLTVHKVKHSLFGHAMKTNFLYYLFSVYFVHQPLHVLDIFVAHRQEVYCIYTTIGTYWAF